MKDKLLIEQKIPQCEHHTFPCFSSGACKLEPKKFTQKISPKVKYKFINKKKGIWNIPDNF